MLCIVYVKYLFDKKLNSESSAVPQSYMMQFKIFVETATTE